MSDLIRILLTLLLALAGMSLLGADNWPHPILSVSTNSGSAANTCVNDGVVSPI